MAYLMLNYFYCDKNCTDQNCILKAPTVLRKFTDVKVYVCSERCVTFSERLKAS